MTHVMTKCAAVGVAIVCALAFSVAAQPQQGALFAISVADDQEIFGITAVDGTSPFPLDPNAAGYAVLLPEGSSLSTFSGQAQVAGTSPPAGGANPTAAPAPAAVAEATLEGAISEGAVSSDTAAGGAGGPLSAECPTDWIELETSMVTLYYFSPDGSADEGPSWRAEPPSFFIRCRPDGRIVVWAGQPGTTPPAI